MLNAQEIFCVLFEFFPEKNRSRNLAQIEKLNIWWARSQYRRTFCQMPFQITIYDPSEQPNYQKIAEKALQLKELGLNSSAIARQLEVDHKTVSRAIEWIKEFEY